MAEDQLISFGAVTIFLMIMLYIIVGAWIEKNRFMFGHEAAVSIIVGIFVSFMAYRVEFEEFSDMMSFDANFFFYFCLPPIVFSNGFNMNRRKFF